MKICGYIYDKDGMRWAEGSLLVRVNIDGVPRLLVVTRAAGGGSRPNRFAYQEHPLDTDQNKVYGEITTSDLARLTRNGEVRLAVVSTNPTDALEIARITADRTESGLYDVVACTPNGRLNTVLDAANCQGADGRTLSEDAVRAAFARRLPEERIILALEQLATMPKSGRAGGPAARLRLSVLVDELETVDFHRAVMSNPDVLLHIEPAAWRSVVARARVLDQPYELRTLLEHARLGAKGQPWTSLLVVAALATGDTNSSSFREVLDRVSREINSGFDEAARPLELLVGHGLHDEVLAILTNASPSARVFCPEMALLLTRTGPAGTRVLESLASTRHQDLASDASVFRLLPPDARMVVLDLSPWTVLANCTSELTPEELQTAAACLSGSSQDVEMVTSLPASARSKVLGSDVPAALVSAVFERVEDRRAREFDRMQSMADDLLRVLSLLERNFQRYLSTLERLAQVEEEVHRRANMWMLSPRHGGGVHADVSERLTAIRRRALAERDKCEKVLRHRTDDLQSSTMWLVDESVSLASDQSGLVRRASADMVVWLRDLDKWGAYQQPHNPGGSAAASFDDLSSKLRDAVRRLVGSRPADLPA